MEKERKIIFSKRYFTEFYIAQTRKVQEKIEFVLQLIRTVEKVPGKFLAHMEGTDGLFEIRVECESNIFRIFCCFDKGNLVILFNGFQKKTQKTPVQELEQAQKLQKEYFLQKHLQEKTGKHTIQKHKPKK
ncbi:type II toxin-antitoxin system RelE/ParE family toxin [Chitinophaga sp. YIM B06452]|uniref:type II toxin-antitoxin system RelE/ParE family toxin n=1 Tax=Chitinophaga sp. YIM B06452 TaxID=3082158 RepID=UPI0031FEF7D9